jgi:hypothetical protein
MIAAIYGRKFPEQTGVADDVKSLARQIEHRKAFAERKGWLVDDHDGINSFTADEAAAPAYKRGGCTVL